MIHQLTAADYRIGQKIRTDDSEGTIAELYETNKALIKYDDADECEWLNIDQIAPITRPFVTLTREELHTVFVLAFGYTVVKELFMVIHIPPPTIPQLSGFGFGSSTDTMTLYEDGIIEACKNEPDSRGQKRSFNALKVIGYLNSLGIEWK